LQEIFGVGGGGVGHRFPVISLPSGFHEIRVELLDDFNNRRWPYVGGSDPSEVLYVGHVCAKMPKADVASSSLLSARGCPSKLHTSDAVQLQQVWRNHRALAHDWKHSKPSSYDFISSLTTPLDQRPVPCYNHKRFMRCLYNCCKHLVDGKAL
jgi:hypothetical protein